MSGYRVDASRLIRVEPTGVFERLLAAPLPEVFSRRYAAFPAIRGVTGAPEYWGTVGQTRTIQLADGGLLRETLTEIDRPHSYSYLLDDIQGSLRPFVHTIDGLWTISPQDAGLQLGWSWTLHTKRSPARLTTSVLGRMWKGYADRALVEMEKFLARG